MIAGVTDGLAALGPETSVTWICAALSDADRAVARSRDAGPACEAGCEEGPRGGHRPVRMLDIAPDTFDRAYNAGGQLRPRGSCCHHALSTPRASRRLRPPVPPPSWERLPGLQRGVRRRPHGGGGDREGGLRVLIQDYHLCLAPRLLRDRLRDQLGDGLGEAGPAAGIGHFCHTPWAPPDYYRMLPDEVGRGAARRHPRRGPGRLSRRALGRPRSLDCCAAVLGADVTRTGLAGPGPGPVGRVTYRGHVTEVGRAPARGERGRAAGARPGRRRPGARRRAPPGRRATAS